MKAVVSKLVISSVALTVLLASVATAGAAVPQGFFSGQVRDASGSAEKAHVFIKTVAIGAVQSTYGVIFREREGSLFRIEELEDGSQSWVELYQNHHHLIGTDINQEATYSGQAVLAGNSLKLALTPTAYGRSIGCVGEIELESSSEWSWVDVPKSDFEINGEGGTKITVKGGQSQKTFSGNFRIGGQVYNGHYQLREIFPGIALVRGQTLSSESESGHAVEKEITAVVVVLHRHRWWAADYDTFKMIRLEPGKGICFGETGSGRTGD